MQNDPRNLGSLISVYRPSTWRIWLLGLVATGPLFLFLLGIVVIVADFTDRPAQYQEGALKHFSGPGICLGGLGLLFAVVLMMFIGEFRKWSGSRTTRLSIYEKGFTYESNGKLERCRWDEIKDTTFSIIVKHSKWSLPRRVNVIRSVIRTDGTFITLSESLDLISITQVIRAARKAD
jgi:hypothetical protein